MRFQEHALNEYRRHAPDCKLDETLGHNCDCPIWALGRIKGEAVPQVSLGNAQPASGHVSEIIKTLLDERAEAKRDEPAAAAPTIAAALADHLKFLRNLRRGGATITSYQGTFKAFEAFCDGRRFRTVWTS